MKIYKCMDSNRVLSYTAYIVAHDIIECCKTYKEYFEDYPEHVEILTEYDERVLVSS